MHEGNPPNGWANADAPSDADASLNRHQPGCTCSATCVAVTSYLVK
jgi:hypothetical protein